MAEIADIASLHLNCQILTIILQVMGANTSNRLPPEMGSQRIGARLKLIREAYGLKPAEIADLLQIERTYWSRFEAGHRPVNDLVSFLLVDRFGVTLDFIILGRWETLRFEVAEKLRAAAGPGWRDFDSASET